MSLFLVSVGSCQRLVLEDVIHTKLGYDVVGEKEGNQQDATRQECDNNYIICDYFLWLRVLKQVGIALRAVLLFPVLPMSMFPNNFELTVLSFLGNFMGTILTRKNRSRY